MPEPTPCDLLITGGTVLDLDGADGRIDAAVAVTDGIVVAVDPAPDATTRWAPQRHIDADGAYVASGFVDGHIHLSAVLGSAQPYARASGPSLFGGAGSTADIGRALHQFLLMPVPADIVEAAVAPVLAALAAGGTTAVIDAGSAGIDGIAAAARRIGVRVAVGPSVHDVLLGDAGEVLRVADAGSVLGAAEDWLTRQQNTPAGLVEPVLTVTEPTFCSDDLLAGLAGLIDRTGVAVSFHSHETSKSVADHDNAHGRAAIDRLAECGLLGPRCTLMHAGSVSDRDIEMIAATRTCVNVNPLGNGMLGFGAAAERAIARYLDAGVRLVLGSDYTPSMIPTGFDLVRAALML
ncbi:MAG: amidohydrolase family protein, partial [Microthrixaceae bacterium]|nr:amidohydrolase family protein [Microthrixaceae bacterium]